MKQRRPSFFWMLGFFIVFLVFLVLLFVFGYWNINLISVINKNMGQIKKIYVDETRYFAKSTVNSLVASIEERRKVLFKDFKEQVRAEDLAWKLAMAELRIAKAKHGYINSSYVRATIIKRLKALSRISPFIDYTVINYDGLDLLAKKRIPQSELKDIFNECIAKGKIINIKWINGDVVAVYARKFPYFDWIILTVIDETLIDHQLQQDWIGLMSDYRYGKEDEGYIIVYRVRNRKGKCNLEVLVDSLNTSLVGKCISFEKAFGDKFSLVVNNLKLKGHSFFEVENNKERNVVFVRYFKPWNWIIGSGVALGNVSKAIGKQRIKAIVQLKSNVRDLSVFLGAIGLFVMVFSFGFVLFIKSKTYKILDVLGESLQENNPVLKEEPVFKEFEIIIRYFSEALDRINTYENDFLKAFVSILEARDVYTKGHSQRVAFYSKRIAEKLGYDQKHQDEIYKAGLLHDIGKVGIPDAVLLKPGRLTENEYRIMRQHPIISYEILARSQRFKHLALWVRQHHEKCDGSGYPDGLKCDAIKEEAKIIEIADIFDALTTTRPYRKSFSVEKSIEIMESEKIDKRLFEISKDILTEAIKEVGDVEVEFMSEQLDKIRNELFNYDFMTGLRVWLSFRRTLKEFVDVKAPFVIYRINIRNMSRINYKFGEDIGDEIIVKTAEVLKSFKKADELFSVEMICRAYADVFFMARRIKKSELLPSFEEESTTIRSYLMEEVFSALFNDKNISNTSIRGIEDYLDFDVFFARYPFDGKTLQDIIYKVESRRKIS